MSFFDRTNLVIRGGTFTQQNNTSITSAFERLQQAVAPGAFHNSGERFNAPKCHPRTRHAVIERIRNWILGKESTNSLIMWLKGSAGTGKSAIAQTIAELCDEEGILLASFFFSRSDPYRNHAKALFPTLAYQLACAIPDARAQLEQAIARDPLIFTRSLEAQLIRLIVEPLQSLTASTTIPWLVIIDGLDEVLDPHAQTKILEVIANGLQQHRIPLIFLIASRPEQQISFTFSTESLSQLTVGARLHRSDFQDESARAVGTTIVHGRGFELQRTPPCRAGDVRHDAGLGAADNDNARLFLDKMCASSMSAAQWSTLLEHSRQEDP